LLRSCIRHWNRDRSRELDQLSNLSHSRRQLFANAAIAASRLRVAVGRLTRYAAGGGGGGFGGLGGGGFGASAAVASVALAMAWATHARLSKIWWIKA
jgi:hypothetical protein